MATFSDKYGAQNLKIIPLHNPESDGTCSCGDKECKSVGKHPRINAWQKEATNDISKIREWKKKWPNMNVGIITGKESGIFVVDIDPRHDGGKSLEGFEREHGKLPPTLTVLTGGGGEHLYYKYPKDIKISNRQEVLPGIDVRAEGGYIVDPPSIHASGKQYAFENTDFEYDKIDRKSVV